MSLPNTISNGQIPDATKVQENFDYLYTLISGGNVLKAGTLQALKTAAQADATTPFIGIGTETDGIISIYIYVVDATKGDEGFILIGGTGGGALSTGDFTEDIG